MEVAQYLKYKIRLYMYGRVRLKFYIPVYTFLNDIEYNIVLYIYECIVSIEYDQSGLNVGSF